MTRLSASLVFLIALEAVAWADFTPADLSVAQFDPDDAVAPISVINGPGIKLGEGALLHVAGGIEGGYTSNVFYGASNPVGAGVLRGMLQASIGSLTGERLASPGQSDAAVEPLFIYQASARIAYDGILSGNDTAEGTGGLNAGVSFHGVVNPAGQWVFDVAEDYARIIRAANFESDENLNRDFNSLALKVLWHPANRSLGGYVYYSNALDLFEQNAGVYPSRLQQALGGHAEWRAFPETQIFIDVSQGYDTGVGDTTKERSLPFTAMAGIQTLLKLNFSLVGAIGYTNGFYSGGPSFSAPTGNIQLGYRYSPFGRVQLSYAHLYSDSINANFYRDDVISLSLLHEIKPVVFEIYPELHFRKYSGITTLLPDADDLREDTIVSVIAGVHYSFRSWLMVALDYHFTDVSTGYRYPVAGELPYDPSYIRHDVLLGVRVTR